MKWFFVFTVFFAALLFVGCGNSEVKDKLDNIVIGQGTLAGGIKAVQDSLGAVGYRVVGVEGRIMAIQPPIPSVEEPTDSSLGRISVTQSDTTSTCVLVCLDTHEKLGGWVFDSLQPGNYQVTVTTRGGVSASSAIISLGGVTASSNDLEPRVAALEKSDSSNTADLDAAMTQQVDDRAIIENIKVRIDAQDARLARTENELARVSAQVERNSRATEILWKDVYGTPSEPKAEESAIPPQTNSNMAGENNSQGVSENTPASGDLTSNSSSSSSSPKNWNGSSVRVQQAPPAY